MGQRSQWIYFKNKGSSINIQNVDTVIAQLRRKLVFNIDVYLYIGNSD
jgi:hypothetical protein